MNRLENLDYCIRYLLAQTEQRVPIPADLDEKQRLFRVLMNIWEPQPLSDEFLQAQDRELQLQLQAKGVIDPPAQPVVLWQGDITRLRVDAIVNAANSRLLGCWAPMHHCIDNAIHSAAGLQLRAECHRLMQGQLEPTGHARVTPAYNLPSRYVIHTVGPIITAPQPSPEQEGQLASCYRACLQAAEEHGCRSLAFCCISTGEFRFPQRLAAQIALGTVAAHRGPSLQTVVFNVFKDSDYAIYRELLPEA